jgi:hypothetical protein
MAYRWQSFVSPNYEKPHKVCVRTVDMMKKIREIEKVWNPARFSVILPP